MPKPTLQDLLATVEATTPETCDIEFLRKAMARLEDHGYISLAAEVELAIQEVELLAATLPAVTLAHEFALALAESCKAYDELFAGLVEPQPGSPNARWIALLDRHLPTWRED